MAYEFKNEEFSLEAIKHNETVLEYISNMRKTFN